MTTTTSADVLVVGGGTAGFGAAVAAGRQGLDVMLLEASSKIGGVMGSGEMMTHDAIVEAGEYYTIPFRALVPKEIENLMFAGRIVSADQIAFASVRGMPQCMAMGQATGTAAAMAIASGQAVQDVDTNALVASLQAQGVRGLGGDSL